MTEPPRFNWTLPVRRIRSFVRREGRLTSAQERALQTLWPRYGLPPGRPLAVSAFFPRPAPLILEIGFGNGESLVEMASQYPEFNYLGVEVHRPGVGHLLLRLAQLGLENVRVSCADAVDFLSDLAAETCQRINIFFPDPWPKKRHHKRRLIQAEFVRLLASRLKPGAYLHLATDWEDYARQMQDVLSAEPTLVNTTEGFADRPADRPLTKFEQRGLRLGHKVWELIFRRV